MPSLDSSSPSMLDNGGRRLRIIYDMMRRDDGVAEDQYLFEFFGARATRIDVAHGRYNPYDHRLNLRLSDQLRWTVALVRDLTDQKFGKYMISILSHCLSHMREHAPEAAHPSLLISLVDEYRFRDYTSLMQETRSNAEAIVAKHYPDGSDVLRKHYPGTTHGWNVEADADVIRKAAARLADLLRTVFHSDYSGEVFGDENSLAEAMVDYLYVSQDLSGIDDDALASAYHSLARLYIRRNDAFDVIIQDEVSRSYRFKSWALGEGDDEWQIRALSPIKIRIMQELDQVEAAADEGTQHHKMAINTIKGAGVHIIFPGQTKEAYDKLQEMLGFSDIDLRWLYSLAETRYDSGELRPTTKAGVCGIMPRDGQFIKAQLLVDGETENQIIRSNRSLDRRLQRRARATARRAERLAKKLRNHQQAA